MEHNDIDNFKKDLDRLRLTERERVLLRTTLMERMSRASEEETVSPYYRSLVGRLRWYGVLVVALIVIAAVPTSLAAERSLPGEALYYLKTEILEPIEETFAFGSEHRSEVVIENAENRIAEQVALQRKGGSVTNATIAKTLFLHKVKKIQQRIAAMETEDLEQKIELQKELLTVLDVYVALFETATTTQETEVASTSVAAQADIVENELRASIGAFVSTAEDQHIIDEIDEAVSEIQQLVDDSEDEKNRTGETREHADERAALEQALVITQQELSERDFAGALETLTFSDHTADIIEKLKEIQEAADELDDGAEETVSSGPDENEE